MISLSVLSLGKKGLTVTVCVFAVTGQQTHCRHKLIIMSQVCKQTVARSSSTLEGSSLKVHRCHYSILYLLSPLRYIVELVCLFAFQLLVDWIIDGLHVV